MRPRVGSGGQVTVEGGGSRGASGRGASAGGVLLAVRRGIFAVVEKLDKEPIEESAKKVQGLIEAGGNGTGAYRPFAASESPPIVYQAVSGSIPVLNAETLEPILRFYAAYSDLTAMAEDVRAKDFQSLNAERRVNAHMALTTHRIATLYWGLRAVKVINAEFGDKNPAVFERSGKNPGVKL